MLKPFLKEWNSTIATGVAVVALIYSNCHAQRSFKLVYKNIEQSNEQLLLQKKSIPAQLSLAYKDIGTSKEQAFITNTGRTVLNVVSAEYKYFFITSDYSVLTGYGVQKKLESDTGLLNTLKTADLIKYPSDITYLLGIPRNFDLKQLAPDNETLLETSPSSIHNAISLAEAINAHVFTRWKIKYYEELSNKQNIAIAYIWMLNPNLERLPIGREAAQRENLEDVSGGQKLIEAINNFEQTTKEVIFGYD